MKVNLSEASKMVGTVTKDGIYKAFKRGAISCERNPVSGQWEVDVAELQRVYAFNPDDSERGSTQSPQTESAKTESDVQALKARLDWVESDLNARLALVSAERDDLRRRLDVEAEERRGLQKLLTHQSERGAEGRIDLMRKLDEAEAERRELQKLLSERGKTPWALWVGLVLALALAGYAVFRAIGQQG